MNPSAFIFVGAAVLDLQSLLPSTTGNHQQPPLSFILTLLLLFYCLSLLSTSVSLPNLPSVMKAIALFPIVLLSLLTPSKDNSLFPLPRLRSPFLHLYPFLPSPFILFLYFLIVWLLLLVAFCYCDEGLTWALLSAGDGWC